MANYPAFTEGVSSLSALGVAKETVFRTPVAATAFTPFDDCTIEETPGTFSPQTQAGVISTDIYVSQGEAKVAGPIKMPLYPVNGVPLFLGSIGQDNTKYNGLFGTPQIASAGTPGSTTSATSFAATGVTSIALTSATGFASSQVLEISGSTDPFGGWETVAGTLSGSTFTVTKPSTGTTKVHTGTITVRTVGALSSGSVAVNDTTISVASGLGALFTTNDYVQIDLNVNGSTTSEIHKVSVSTDTLTITDASPNAQMFWAHATAVMVFNVTGGLYAHQVPSGALNSYTVERNVAGRQSLQFPGIKFSKGSLTCPSGNVDASLSVDAMGAAQPIVLDSPTAATNGLDAPFQFNEATLTVLGAGHSEAYNLQINWDNVVKDTFTYAQSHFASFLTKTNLHVTGTFDAVWDSYDDATYGFWTKMDQQTQGSLRFQLQHASDSSMIDVLVPLIVLDKLGTDTKVGAIVNQKASFQAFYNVASAQANMVATCWNSNPYPY